MAVQVNWNKCVNDKWCPLISVNLNHDHFENLEGVYIIWHGGGNPHVVRVGQGVIKERLAAHREDKQILAYKNLGLFVTWAQVSMLSRDGVERYLAESCDPIVGERFPQVVPIHINLPWA